MLEGISGGTLDEGWQDVADQLFPSFKSMPQYANFTYEQACEELKKYVSDPEDYKQICEYIKKYF